MQTLQQKHNAEYMKKWSKSHPDKVKNALHKWYLKNKKRCLEYQQKYHKINSNYRRDSSKKRRQRWKNDPRKYTKQIKQEKETRIKWNKENPRSNRGGTIELQLAMNNVRIRDDSSCQWYGCSHNFKNLTIDVHHIFPRKEYSELELIEQYMICYCREHHNEFHIAKGEVFGFLKRRYK